MGYVLQALLGRPGLLRAHLDAHPLARVVPLGQGIGMIPVTHALREGLEAGSGGGVREEAYPEGIYYLSAAVVAWAERISRDGPVAYVEADYFGGVGTQGAVAWHNGRVILGPLVTEREPSRAAAINRALRLLGATADEAVDEFGAVGLSRQRSTEAWLEG